VTRKEDTSGLDPLSAESARLAEEEREWWRQSEEDFQERIEQLEKKIGKMGRPELDVLTRAGVDRKSMLKLLALASDVLGLLRTAA
jgi:hypothetical protein